MQPHSLPRGLQDQLKFGINNLALKPGGPDIGDRSTRRSWSKAAAAVGDRGWQAITVDLRGHGESGGSEEGDYSLTSLACH
jgi:pimeloyl-ACP methyl ester carboxylesterase